ncbi:hypothetical protein BBOV_III011460 [Babesia bovis T2Bo]|uniref:B box-type domain-containing protein n=1 Tax=Babesia bovis TaxID=5865 RepID=A7AQ64_BABBO|nr:hypothetical protein BBOV_III011460 [Babesia bovis T2Bo]EDO08698.1 hypothetical protein BBOV_III011460 [Babesia bovis T2Bo]BAN64659.1 hypothetical protein [Babesia bovis]|eukprot:XP_001612266.1 hypothetical protein [Babesia bovis T2Bo]
MFEHLEGAIPLKAGKPTESTRTSDAPGLTRHSIDSQEWSQPGVSFASVENVRCPHHYALPIQYFCLDCKFGEGCFCSECALTRHASCDVRTLDEAYNMILNNVIRKWASQFSSRTDSLEVTFAQQLVDKREEWTMKLQEVQTAIMKTSDDITTTLRDMETKLLQWINQSHKSFMEEHDRLCEHVESTLESYANNAEMLRQQRRLSPARLLLFYHENHVKLKQMLVGTTPRDSERVIRQATRHLGVRLDNINSTCVEFEKEIAHLERSIRNAGAS